MSSQGFSTAFEMSFISSAVNPTILLALFLGFYTFVYTGTLYVYLNKKSSQHWIVIGATSLLYFAYAAYTIISWYLAQHEIIYDSETRESLFASITTGSTLPQFTLNVLSFVMAAVGDGIVIWRCFNVWNRSLRAALLPAALLVCEIALDLAVVIIQCANDFELTLNQIIAVNHLSAAVIFVTFATTLSATFLISYRIYKTSKYDITVKSKKRFKQIVEILVQSSSIYSIASLADAISLVVPQNLSNAASWYAVNQYISVIFVFTAGVAPTIMVARVAFLESGSERGSRSAVSDMQISDLRFHSAFTGGSESLSIATYSPEENAETKKRRVNE